MCGVTQQIVHFLRCMETCWCQPSIEHRPNQMILLLAASERRAVQAPGNELQNVPASAALLAPPGVAEAPIGSLRRSGARKAGFPGGFATALIIMACVTAATAVCAASSRRRGSTSLAQIPAEVAVSGATGNTLQERLPGYGGGDPAGYGNIRAASASVCLSNGSAGTHVT
jgi:hypothetical protein